MRRVCASTGNRICAVRFHGESLFSKSEDTQESYHSGPKINMVLLSKFWPPLAMRWLCAGKENRNSPFLRNIPLYKSMAM